MIHTPICDLLDIRVPVVQAGMGSFTSAELVAAVTNAGGLGSLGAANHGDWFKSADGLRDLRVVELCLA